jgi:hypothetical protein
MRFGGSGSNKRIETPLSHIFFKYVLVHALWYFKMISKSLLVAATRVTLVVYLLASMIYATVPLRK